MTDEQKAAYDWAKRQKYGSVAATYARELAGVIDELQSQLAEATRRADAAVADIEDLMSITGIDTYETCGYCQREDDEKCFDKNNPGNCLAKWRGAEKGATNDNQNNE